MLEGWAKCLRLEHLIGALAAPSPIFHSARADALGYRPTFPAGPAWLSLERRT